MPVDFDTLAECSYEGRSFPLADGPSDGGNDFASHVAYRRPGVDLEPTGRKPYSGTLTIPCINSPRLVARYGRLWPDLCNDLKSLFVETPIGTLSHPTIGNLTAGITDWSETASSDVRNGVTLTVKWTEHNATLSLLVGADGSPVNDPTTAINDKAEAADALGESFSGYVPVAATIEEQATFLETAPRSYTEVVGAFKRMNAAVAFDLALPSLAGVSGYPTIVALLALRTALQSYQSRFVPAGGVRFYVVPNTMALWQVAQLVYGDISKVGLLLSSNAVLDTLAVAAGTVLTVLPLS